MGGERGGAEGGGEADQGRRTQPRKAIPPAFQHREARWRPSPQHVFTTASEDMHPVRFAVAARTGCVCVCVNLNRL